MFLTQTTFSFNSSVVRLKVEKLKSDNEKIECFNSSVVRLKATIADVDWTDSEFQFQCGSIKSLLSKSLMILSKVVSIPVWFD